MNCGNTITTLSVSNLHIIAAAPEVKVFPSTIESGTSAPGISESQTCLLMTNLIAQSWCARHLVPGMPGIVYLLSGTHFILNWQIGRAFSSLTASSMNSWSNSLLIALRTVWNIKQVLSGSRTSSPSSTWTWTSFALLLVIIWSSMISFSYSNVRCADGLIPRWSWNSWRC